MNADTIEQLLSPKEFYRIDVRQQTDSTNLQLKNLALQGAQEGCVCIAQHQTAGRGRLGRSFFSPGECGLYMSILLRPDTAPSDACNLTTMTAVVVCEALETCCGIQPGIKWVNDILLDGKKICGILTESQIAIHDGQPVLEWAVVGLGINLQQPESGYPEDIRNIAGALYSWQKMPETLPEHLCAEILNRFYLHYHDNSSVLSAYRARCVTPGHSVWVHNTTAPDTGYPAQALSITDNFGLLVRSQDGSEHVLSSGEISARLIKSC